MGDALKINSIPIPVESCTRDADEEGGQRGRSYSGTAQEALRYLKARWKGRTTIQPHVNALALRGLFSGDGHTWSFEAQSVYSSRGRWPTAAGIATWGYRKFGTYGGRVPQSTSVSWALGSRYGYAWTIVCWKADADCTTWHHYAINSDGGKWVDGVASGAALTWAFLSSGTFYLSAPAGANDMAVDDILVVPYVMPSTWPVALFARNAALPSLPSFDVAGDLIHPTRTYSCRGRAGGSEYQQAVYQGAWAQNLSAVDFSLEEA